MISGAWRRGGRAHSWIVDFGTSRYPAVSRKVKTARATRGSSAPSTGRRRFRLSGTNVIALHLGRDASREGGVIGDPHRSQDSNSGENLASRKPSDLGVAAHLGVSRRGERADRPETMDTTVPAGDHQTGIQVLWRLGMDECGDEALRDLTESFWFGIGRGSAAAYAAHEAWLFRRVETIEFVGRRSVKRSVSVDFEVPSGLPDLRDHAAKDTVLVPISVFDKWPPLMDFNFVGPSGHPASRYLGTTSNQLNFGLMLGMVDRAFALGASRAEHVSWEARRHVRRRLGHPEPERLPLALRRELALVVQSPRPLRRPWSVP